MPSLALPSVPGVDMSALVGELRRAGAIFGFLHGSWVTGTPRSDSDVDVAAMFPPASRWWEAAIPSRVDLSSLRDLPLHVAGRVALDGLLLFDDDPPARVHWQADTRQRYLDEAPRREAVTATILRAASRG